MPKQTFFNLPEAKRQRIIDAAKEVFYHASYEEASINQVIKLAGIPRGSFYQYFADKADLYGFLRHRIAFRLLKQLKDEIHAVNYDLFQASREILPQWLEETFYGRDAEFYYRMIEMISRRQLPNAAQKHETKRELLSPQDRQLAANKLAIPEGDVQYLIQELFMTYLSAVSEGAKQYEAGERVDLDRLNQLLDRRIGYLEHGFEAGCK